MRTVYIYIISHNENAIHPILHHAAWVAGVLRVSATVCGQQRLELRNVEPLEGPKPAVGCLGPAGGACLCGRKAGRMLGVLGVLGVLGTGEI